MCLTNRSDKFPPSIDPACLINKQKKDKIADFFLVLAFFYNDLKDIFFHVNQTQIEFQNVNKKKISFATGEYNGIVRHLQRLMISILHEFFNFIETNKETLKTREFCSLYEKLDERSRNNWDSIIKVSTNNGSMDNSNFLQILLLIRHNLTFHYYQSQNFLREGFCKHFFDDPKNDANTKAYYSIGNNMKNTRFFYCDASASRLLEDQIEKEMTYDKFRDTFSKVVEDLNFVIMNLMEEYLKQKSC